MATTARLGIDIVGTDRTRAGFASVQRSMAGLNRTANQLKIAFGGLVGGNILASFIRSMVRINRQAPEVDTAIGNLGRAWQGFALKVGNAGLNSALIDFANRMGSMIMGTDGLAKSIGAFLGGAVNVMAGVFEGIGRSIAFVYDNLGLLGKILASIGLVAAARQLLGIGAAMIRFGIAVRSTGLLMVAFRSISNASLYTFLFLAAGVAYATDSVDTLKQGIDRIWQTAKQVFPLLADAGKNMGEAFGVDFTALSNGFADTDRYLASLPPVLAPATQATAKLGAAAKTASVNFKGLADTAKESTAFFSDVGRTFSDAFGTAFNSVIDGTESVKTAFSSMATSVLKNLTNMLANSAIQRLFSGAAAGGFVSSLFSRGPALPTATFGGPKAAGGPVRAGMSYTVGERGPERLVMGQSGTIIPNRASGGISSVQIIDQRHGGAAPIRSQNDGLGNLQVIVRDAVNETIGKGFADRSMKRFGAQPVKARRT